MPSVWRAARWVATLPTCGLAARRALKLHRRPKLHPPAMVRRRAPLVGSEGKRNLLRPRQDHRLALLLARRQVPQPYLPVKWEAVLVARECQRMSIGRDRVFDAVRDGS